jgi:hypothetical protein
MFSFISVNRKYAGKTGQWVELREWWEVFSWLAWSGGDKLVPSTACLFLEYNAVLRYIYNSCVTVAVGTEVA